MTVARLLIAICALLFAATAASATAARHLIVGSEQDYPPFALGNTDETAGGFTVDLWKIVARDAGLSYSIRVKPFHELLEEFKQGKIDVLINLAQSEERHKFADFTIPHVIVHAAIFTRDNSSDIHGEADLKNKSVIVVQADIAHEYAVSKDLTRHLVLVPTAADGMKLLASAQHDALLVSKLVGLQTLEQLKLDSIDALPILSGATQKFAFAVRKGDAELLALLNEGLALSKSSGGYAALYQQWFGIYEPKEFGLRDLLKYILPLLAIFAVYVVATHFRRIAERRKAMQQLAESHHMLQTVVESTPMRLFWKDRDSRYLGSNTLFASDAGMNSPDELVGKLDTDCAWREFAGLYREDDRKVIESGQAKLAYEEPYTTRDGEQLWVRTSKTPLRAIDGSVVGVLGILYDITEVKRAQEQMLLATMVYENSSESMMVTDADGTIIAINPAFTKTTGYTLEEVCGKNPRILKSGRHDQAFYQAFWQVLNTTGYWQGEIWDTRKNGEEYPKWLTINTTFDAQGRPYRRVALFSDISEKKKSEQLIWQQANFDNLTGLPNRCMFHVQLEHEIKKSRRNGQRLAVMFIDLDRFKEVNDTLGHAKGDALLAEAAHRLRACVRESDTVARLGGDEFTIILGEVEEIWGIDRIVGCILKSLSSPFTLGEEVVYVSASIGITLYPDDAESIDTLLKNADQAMYEAKHQGRNRYSYFTRSIDDMAKSRMRISNDLRVALQENQFWIAYQPIVDIATGEIRKAEALLRWQHPTRGLVSPAEFIPIAEETGIIVELGNWVFREATRQASQWRTLYDGDFQISVNKSPVQFLNDGIRMPGWLEQMQETGVSAKSVVVEITESLLLDAAPDIDRKLFKFRDMGMEVAIDDFGTGYSSLAYLKKFDIDYLKIDKTFIDNLGNGTEDLVLCEAIIVMAHKLGIKVIAEGVETREQLDLLRTAGCDYAQGYYYSRPVEAAAFEVLLGKRGNSG